MASGEITLGKSLCLRTFWSLFWCVAGWWEGWKKWRTSWCGWGRCLIFLKVEMYPSHPPFCHNRLVFFILSNRFLPLKSWRRGGEGNGHSGLKTNSLKNVGTKWKEAYSHGGSVSCHWPLRCAEIMCLSQGLLISRPWDKAWGTPPGQTRAPPKNHLTLPTLLNSVSPPPSRANSRSG